MQRSAVGLAGLGFLLALTPLLLGQSSPLPLTQVQFTDQNGTPLGGGSVKFCVPNTGCNTLKATWKDSAQTQVNLNPVPLDAGGRASIFGSGSYEEQIYDVNGNLVLDGLTSAVNGGLLVSVPAGSLLGNAGSQAQAPAAIAVAPPLAFGQNGLTVQQSVVADNSNQLVDGTFANSERYTTGNNSLSYTLSTSLSLGSGFAFTILANVPVTVQTTGGDTLQGSSTGSLSIQAGQNVSLVTNGQGLWFASVTAQVGQVIGAPGQVVQMRGTTCPAGTLAESGAAVSRTTYALLFAVIGTNWGSGDGSTTFNLPNAGGQFNRGWESAQTTDAGRVFGSAQQDALQDHAHSYSKTNSGNTGATTGAGANQGFSPDTTGSPIAPTSGANSGVAPRVAAETRPVNITELSCIATGKTM